MDKSTHQLTAYGSCISSIWQPAWVSSLRRGWHKQYFEFGLQYPFQLPAANITCKVHPHLLLFGEISQAKSSHSHQNSHDWEFYMRMKNIWYVWVTHANSLHWPTESCLVWLKITEAWMYNSTNQWGQAFYHWCLAVLSHWYTWLYKGVTSVFFLSFPLFLPFDWTLRYWMCLLFCFVIFWMLC